MPYVTGNWGLHARLRSKRRKQYFLDYQRKRQGKDPRKYVTNGIARRSEMLATEFLVGSQLDNCSSHDVLWQDKKIEVKVSCLSKRPTQTGWWFCTGRQRGQCDYFFLVCLAADKKTVIKTFLVPSMITPTCLAENSKRLDQFEVKSPRKEV